MKYLKLFNNKDQFNNWITSNNYIIPNIVKLKNDKYIDYKANLNYNYVDLGLPSGTLWATKNIGAQTETDFGLYFAWGETKGYYYPSEEKSFTWNDYKFSINGSDSNFSKYTKSTGDNMELIDNPVYTYMGNEWDMPDLIAMHEVNVNCTSQYVSNYKNSGTNGILFTSTINSKTLFFPFACAITNNIVENKTTNPFVWMWYKSCTQSFGGGVYIDNWQNSLRIMTDHIRYRYYGCTCRGIKRGNN